MSLQHEMLQEGWTHDAGSERVEHVCAYNPELAGRVGRIALRFIQKKGLSGEFADLLEEIDQNEAEPPLESAP